MTTGTQVIGVDGCKSGWCTVCLGNEIGGWTLTDVLVCGTFSDVLALEADIVCIDVPIGLMDSAGQRACDVEARKLLGAPRASSVFPPPSRAATQYRDLEASTANFRRTGKLLSKQTQAIVPKIHEVDEIMISKSPVRVREVHPELCFFAMNSRKTMPHNKKTAAGKSERWEVLREVLPSLGSNPSLPEQLRGHGCSLDDYIDALAAAWTARCIAVGAAERVPTSKAFDAYGLPMEMWFPSSVQPTL
jgi:predicted RNase H-like nuclease